MWEKTMKPFMWLFFVAIVITGLGDLLAAQVIATTQGEFVLLIVAVAGIGWAWTCWAGPPWVAIVALANAVIHVTAWFTAASFDRRTFYGGAMFPIISFWSWLMVTLVVIPAAILRFVKIARRGKQRSRL